MAVQFDFQETGYLDDFEFLMDAPARLVPPDRKDDTGQWDIWFKADDTSGKNNQPERGFAAHGIEFDCYVWVRHVPSDERLMLAHFPARDQKHAESQFAYIASQLGL